MKIFLIRLFLTFLVQIFLYQKSTVYLGLAIVVYFFGGILSCQKIYQSTRDRILSLLSDKIFFCSTLVALVDLEVLPTILAAWVIGVVFIHSGVDLLQSSLHVGSQDLRFSWFANLIHMGFVLIVILICFLQKQLGAVIYDHFLYFISWAWVLFTIALLIRSLFSEKFRRMIKEA